MTKNLKRAALAIALAAALPAQAYDLVEYTFDEPFDLWWAPSITRFAGTVTAQFDGGNVLTVIVDSSIFGWGACWQPLGDACGEAFNPGTPDSWSALLPSGYDWGAYVYVDEATQTLWARGPSFGIEAALTRVPAIPAIPEPGTWALLLAGLGVAGALQRRRA